MAPLTVPPPQEGENAVPELSDAALVEALRRQMSMAATRQVVAASNLANVDTPGYRAQEIDFTQALDRQLGSPLALAKTTGGHVAGTAEPTSAGDVSGIPTRDVEGAVERRDGNTVQIDRELLTMVGAAGDFSRAQTALAAKFRLLRYAINEGR
jgi:flagellar basal-body rod protein FlgB